MRCRKRKCRYCRQWFVPQPHNAYHQRYCTEPECRHASKRHSQRKWLKKNPDQYRGSENVLRVQCWRAEHPGYWRELCPRDHLRLDLFLPRKRHRHPIRLRGEHRNTGGLQELFLPHPVMFQELSAGLEAVLRDLIGPWWSRCYVDGERTGGL